MGATLDEVMSKLNSMQSEIRETRRVCERVLRSLPEFADDSVERSELGMFLPGTGWVEGGPEGRSERPPESKVDPVDMLPNDPAARRAYIEAQRAHATEVS